MTKAVTASRAPRAPRAPMGSHRGQRGRRARNGLTGALLTALLALPLGACSADSGGPSVPPPSVGAESTPPGSSGPAPSPSVSVAAHGQTSPECIATSQVLNYATAIGLKTDSGLIEQNDIDRAFSTEATAGVPQDAMVYVEAAKAVAVNFVGKDAAAAAEFLNPWQKAYADLTAASLATCR